MWTPLRQLRGKLATGPNRIAFAWALRGTIATGLPLLTLPALGMGPLSNLVMGALNTSMVDVGGSYRSRLAAMALWIAAATGNETGRALVTSGRNCGWLAPASLRA